MAIRDGKTVDLTAKEYDLIELLMRNPRRVYSREKSDERGVGLCLRRGLPDGGCPHPPPAEKAGEKEPGGAGVYYDQVGELDTISKDKGRIWDSLQFKFGLSYILIIAGVLLLLNTYPLRVSQDLVFRSKEPRSRAACP